MLTRRYQGSLAIACTSLLLTSFATPIVGNQYVPPVAPAPKIESNIDTFVRGAVAFAFLPSAKPTERAPAPKPLKLRHVLNFATSGWLPLSVGRMLESSTAPPLGATPGMPKPWHASAGVHKGVVNLSSGNLLLAHNIAGWGSVGPGVNFTIYFNSQSGDSSALGPKWSHSYNWSIDTSNKNMRVVTAGDGSKTTFEWVSGDWQAPTGTHEALETTGTEHLLKFKNGTVYHFDLNGVLQKIADAHGNEVIMGYTSSLLTTVTDDYSRTLTLSYTSGKLTGVTDCESRSWVITYDGSDRVYEVKDPLLNSTQYKTTFGYGTNNNVTTVTNRLNKSWTYSYGSGNVFASVSDPYSNATVASWDVPGLGFDPLNPWPISVQVVAEVEDPDEHAVKFGLDTEGFLRASRDGYNKQTVYGYDADNNRDYIKMPRGGEWNMTFDTRGNMLTQTNPLNKTTTWTYNAQNNVTSVTDAESNVTTYGWTGYDMTSMTDGSSRTWLYEPNGDGTIHKITDPASKITEFGYDAFGNRDSMIDPLSNQWTWDWDCCKLESKTDPMNRTTGYDYDEWGRLKEIDYPTSTDVVLGYDPEGRITSSVDGTGSRSYTYNDIGLKTYQTDPRGNTSATYYPGGHLESQTDVTNRLVEYGYDDNGRQDSISDSSSSISKTFDDDGNLETETYSNGVRAEYTHNLAGQLTHLVYRKISNNSVIMGYVSEYWDNGRLKKVTEAPSGAETTYTYDGAGRLLNEDRDTGVAAGSYESAYTYNTRGLRDTGFRSEEGVTSHNHAYEYNDAGWLTKTINQANESEDDFTWHEDGTLASYPGPGYTRVLEYDEEQRLIAIKRDDGNTVTTTFTYGYAFDGQRRWRKDHLGDRWDWYPCGVACCAGELVALTSDLSGTTWGTLKTVLPGTGGSRHGSHFSGSDMLLPDAIATDSSADLDGWRIRDRFGLAREVAIPMPSPVPEDLCTAVDDDEHYSLLASRAIKSSVSAKCYLKCGALALLAFISAFRNCISAAGGPCKLCIGTAIAMCIGASVATCITALKVCARVCGRVLPACIAAASFVASTRFNDCLRSCRRSC
jgi:YD repeat-containing protein